MVPSLFEPLKFYCNAGNFVKNEKRLFTGNGQILQPRRKKNPPSIKGTKIADDKIFVYKFSKNVKSKLYHTENSNTRGQTV